MYLQCLMQNRQTVVDMRKRFDESVLAEKTAQLLGRKFSRSIITPEQFFDIVPYVMYNMEQPLGDASAIVFTLGCNATAEHTKSVIPERVLTNSSVVITCTEMPNVMVRI